MPEPRSGLNGAAICQAVVVAGGETSSDVFATVQIYDPVNDAWQSLPELPVPVHGVAIAASDSHILAIGGSTAAGQIQNITDVYALDLSDTVRTCPD